jgi:hypothetical protein
MVLALDVSVQMLCNPFYSAFVTNQASSCNSEGNIVSKMEQEDRAQIVPEGSEAARVPQMDEGSDDKRLTLLLASFSTGQPCISTTAGFA